MYKSFFCAILISVFIANAKEAFDEVSDFEKIAIDLLSDFIKNDKQKVHFRVITQEFMPGLEFSSGLTLNVLSKSYEDDLIYLNHSFSFNLNFGNIEAHLQPGIYANFVIRKNFIPIYRKR